MSLRSATVCVASVGVLLAATSLQAQRMPDAEPMHGFVRAPAGFVATPAPAALASLGSEIDPAVVAEAEAFRATHGDWRFYVDRRSGAIALAEGAGIPWLAAEERGSLSGLESQARALVEAYPSLLPFSAADLVLDTAASRQLGERGQLWNLAFHQRLDGVEVADSQLVFRVSHGRLVQFGATRLVATRALRSPPRASATVSPAGARAALGSYLGGLEAADTFTEPEHLLWVLRGAEDRVGYGGPVGEGWQLHLAYRSTFQRAGSSGSWRSLVDARSGEVLRFVDATDYAAVLRASVYPNVNCLNPSSCVPGDVAEVAVTMPNARLNFVGGSCTGDACYTNSAGGFDYPPGAISAATALDGKYFTLGGWLRRRRRLGGGARQPRPRHHRTPTAPASTPTAHRRRARARPTATRSVAALAIPTPRAPPTTTST